NWRILNNSMGDLLPLEVAKATYLVKEEQGLVTPSTTKVKASGEEQVEDISPNILLKQPKLSPRLPL
ncbi:hypothetical protein Tco_0661643, partial [Tanacetum coccineum]